jgi:hypothetical protein
VESLVLSAAGDEVALVRFTAAGAEAAVPAWAWRAKLPARAIEIAAALGPARTGSKRYVAILSGSAGKYETAFATFGGADSGLSKFQTLAITGVDGMSPVPGAFAVAEDAKGGARILSMFHSAANKTVSLVESVFEPGQKPVVAVKTYRGSWPEASAVKTGTLIPVVDATGAYERSEALVQLADGFLLRFDGENHSMEPALAQGKATAPMLLAPGKTGVYIVFQDEKRGLYPERQ